MSENAISAQGTLIARQPLGVGDFETIGELRDINGPALTRNPIDMTAHNDVEEHYAVGIRRKGEMTFMIGYRPSLASHGRTEGLVHAWRTGSRDIYRLTFPDGPDPETPTEGGTQWLFSGYVTNLEPAAPVDDALTMNVTIRPTNTMTFVDAEEA
jgi:hypothetical protein